MTKQDIIQLLEERTDLSLSQSTHAVNGVIGILADALAKEEPVFLRGFGTIKTVRRAARAARNISKGTTISLPARKQVKFIAYNALKCRINNTEYVHPDILP